MSTTYSEGAGTETVAYGGLVDAVGGIATVVLAIIGLAGVHADVLMPIAVIVFGAALLIQGGTMLSEFASVPGFASTEQLGASGISSVFLVGAGGIVLGVLALIGIAASTLVAVSVIAFGAAVLISSNSVRQLGTLHAAMAGESTGTFVAGEMASGSAAVQLLAGLTSIVLGILAIVGIQAATLIASALIVLGAAVLLSGSTLTGVVMGFMPNERPRPRAHIVQ
jgi:hypothetical protein